MTLLSDISSVHWQPALHSELRPAGSPLRGQGVDVVEAEADVGQCIRTILNTPKGSDPHRPDFGSDLHLYIDHPVNEVRPHLVREAVEAIRRWEPRCELLKVIVSVDEAHVTLRVQWQLADGVLRETEVRPWR
ncbi:GPW/gp25 family protein [Jeongeupia wiesaeckerbachi]|uniref:GPW/gp25 family protein n=1 Tax=Jeongeupia wiesaeckerbachi TaxID=3051218 RepID=UPI003D80630E